MRRRFLTSLALLFALSVPAAAQRGGRLPTLAPYRDIVWASETEPPLVLLGGEWHELLSIDGVAVADIVAAARSGFGDDWQRRFAEDLVEVLSLRGSTPDSTVELGLRDQTTARTSTRTAAMTLVNRQSILQARRAREVIGSPLTTAPSSFVTTAFNVWLHDSATARLDRVSLPGDPGAAAWPRA